MRAVSRSTLAALQDELDERGLQVAAMALVASSDTDPASIHNPHMRAHASEGRLFRDALAEATEGCNISCFVVLEKNVLGHAADALGWAGADLAQVIAALGKQVEPPWRADEKAACAAAWLALSRQGR